MIMIRRRHFFIIFRLRLFLALWTLGLSAAPLWAQQEITCAEEAKEKEFSITRGFEAEDIKLVKAFINQINGEIPVNEEEEKTWKVYTLPILKRKNVYFIRNQEGEIVGYAALRDDENYLSWIAIKKEYRGSAGGHLAKKLMVRLLNDYEKIVLDVRSSNHRAIKFYENLVEIAEVDKRPGEKYKNGEQGWVFTIGPKKERPAK